MKLIVDSGFWYGLADVSDAYNNVAAEIFNRLKTKAKFLIPYPTLYEVLDTRLMKPLKDGSNPRAGVLLAKFNGEPNRFLRIKDTDYIDQAYRLTAFENRRGLSFVDNIIRVMLADNSLKIDGLITFNTKDFADVCRNRIVIYDQYNLP